MLCIKEFYLVIIIPPNDFVWLHKQVFFLMVSEYGSFKCLQM